jgi:serine protease inhibitor
MTHLGSLSMRHAFLLALVAAIPAPRWGVALAQAPRPAPAAATTQFDADLLRAVVATSNDRNVFISPLSAGVAIAMAYEGADGSTRQAIRRTLGLAPRDPGSPIDEMAARLRALSSDRSTTISVANALWSRPDAPIEPAFTRRMRSAFGAEVAAVDLTSPSTVARVNSWVSRQTRGRIDKLLAEPLPPDAVAVLTSAVYFKASWTDAFEVSQTAARPFHVRGGKAEPRPAMRRRGDYAYAQRDGFQVVRMPYRGGRFGMYVLLPDERTSVDSLLGMLAPARSAQWLAALQSREVTLQLPKFRLDYAVDLVSPLTSMGMGVAFDPKRASFGRMLPASYLARRNAFIGAALQKTFVVVNEEGTEAAASTMLSIHSDTVGAPVSFTVDRPFVLLIREESQGTVLFVGRILDPR